MRDETKYAYDNSRAVQSERLAALAEALDPGTVRHLDSIGVGRGWRCLEVGAGGGSIAAWLSERVAGDGAVVATDLDTTVLRELSRPNLEIRVHDVLEDDLPEGLAGAGLEDVACDGRVSMWRGAEVGGALWRLTVIQVREAMLASGLVTEADIEHVLALCDDPAFSSVSPIVMAARGRRPA